MTVARAATALITACLLIGCGTKVDWRARYNALWQTNHSCASGYYDCSLRTSNDGSLNNDRKK
jgi:hypothetical protein